MSISVDRSDDESPTEESKWASHQGGRPRGDPSAPASSGRPSQNSVQQSIESSNVQRAVPGSGERRASCDFCSRRKRKCDGQQPCQNCRKLNLNCHFSVKQKSGRKRKPREGEDASTAGRVHHASALKKEATPLMVLGNGFSSPTSSSRKAGMGSIVPGIAARARGTGASWANGAMGNDGGGNAVFSTSKRNEEGSVSDGGEVGGADAGDGMGGGGWAGSPTGDMRSSCDFCNRRKRRCNGEKPCDACLRAGNQDHCVYSAKRKAARSPYVGRQRPRREDANGNAASVGGHDPVPSMGGAFTSSPQALSSDLRHGGEGSFAKPPALATPPPPSHTQGGVRPEASADSAAGGMVTTTVGGPQMSVGTSGVKASLSRGPSSSGGDQDRQAGSAVEGSRSSGPSPSAMSSGDGGGGSAFTMGSLSWANGPESPMEERPLSSSHGHGHTHGQGHGSTQTSSGLHHDNHNHHLLLREQQQLHHAEQNVAHLLQMPRQPAGSSMKEAEAAAARAVEAKARSDEAKARSEAAAAEAAAAVAAAEVAREAATAVVEPLPATREKVTTDGRVGRRENAFLDTYFAFFGRFARLESESEARRTLIELALQDNRPFPVGASAVAPASHSSMGGGGGDTTADMGQAFASANTAGVASSGAVEGLPSHSASAAGGPRSQGPGPGGGGGVAGTAARFGPGTDAYDASGGLRRGVGPEKGARLWAGVGIGAMLQGASPADGEMYAAMATEQLAGARVPGNNEESMKGAKSGSSIGIPGTLADLQGQGGSGAGAGAGAVGNGVQERVRADLMLAVLYDMLGRYEESDGYLAAAVDCVADAPTHLRDVVDLLMAAKQERGDVHVSAKHQHQNSQHSYPHSHNHHNHHHHHPHHATGSNEGGGTCPVSGSAGSAASRLKSESGGSSVPGGLSCMSSAPSEEGCGGRENGRGSGGTGGQVAGGRASGGGGGVASAVGMGESRQQTPMLITEGNALSLLNRLSWETLRRFTRLPFASASRGAQGGSRCQALAEWRSAESWYGTLTKAHSHLCADLNDDVRALPRCPLAVGLLKSKLSWLHSCLGRTEAAADKSQVMLRLLEPFPGAGRWSLWRHPLHLAACHLAIAGRPGAYEKLRRTFNAFRLPGQLCLQVEHPPFETFHRISELCPTCSPTLCLLVKAYKPQLAPMLGSPVGGAPSLGASGRLNVFMGTEDFGLQGSGQPVEFSAPPVALVGGGKDGVAPGSSGELAVGLGDIGYKEAGDQKRDAAAGASSGASSTSGGLVGGMAALEYYPPSYASSVSGGTGKAAGNGGGGGADAAGARPDPGRADAGVAALSDGEHALDGEEATDGDSWKSSETEENQVGMFGPGTRTMDRHPSFHDYQVLMEVFAGDQHLNASLATPLDPTEDLLGEWEGGQVDPDSCGRGVFGPGTGSAEDDVEAAGQSIEHMLFGYPNPAANFGPQYTPLDHPAPAEVTPDTSQSTSSAQTAAATAVAAATAMLRQDAQNPGTFPSGVSVACP